MIKIIRNKKNVKHELRNINKVVRELSRERMETINFRNFIPEYLSKLFDAIHVKMPTITYNIEFTGPYQTIRLSSCGLSWTIMNNNNVLLYYPNLDIFLKRPIAVVLPIFVDMATMLGYNDDGAIELLIQEKK